MRGENSKDFEIVSNMWHLGRIPTFFDFFSFEGGSQAQQPYSATSNIVVIDQHLVKYQNIQNLTSIFPVSRY